MNWSFLLKAKPYQDLAIIMLSTFLPDTRSISSMVCVLCPLLVTASHFLLLLTTRLRGRSPRVIFFPAGVNDQPFGSPTLFDSRSANVWALEKLKVKNATMDNTSVKMIFLILRRSL